MTRSFNVMLKTSSMTTSLDRKTADATELSLIISAASAAGDDDRTTIMAVINAA